ncbi:hypothetical protein F5I97DRAFT_1775993, partial [Phlebopus sp. FC_14]
PLAIINKLIETFGADICSSYDISHKLQANIFKSAVGSHALLFNYSCIVPMFHKHA